MNNLTKHVASLFLVFTSIISFAQGYSKIESKDQILEKLENDGIKSGMTIWLKEPLRKYDGYSKISGLSKLIFLDAELEPEFKRIPTSKKQITISVQDGAAEPMQLILSTSTLYFIGEHGTALGKIYIKDPKNITSKWNSRVITAISQRSVVMGMKPDQIRASWGSPNKVNRSAGPWGRSEQWIFGDFPDSTYLYLENGKLTSWQD